MATVFAPFSDTEPEEFRRATEVTYLGSVWGTMAALERMRPRDRGVIVQVGSALAYRGIPLQAAYCGAKHALQGFLESLRTELLHDGSNVRADDGAAAGAEHAAVHLEPREDAARSRSPCRRSSSPRSPPRRSSSRPTHPRREVMVGWPTVKAIFGNAVAPGGRRPLPRRHRLRGAADRRAARSISARGTCSSRSTGDQGAHGPFDSRAKPYSVQLWTTKHRRWLGLAGATGLAAAQSGQRSGGKE